MRLYLSANSKNNIGYIPDWLKVTYEENGQFFDLTLDINGTIEFNYDCLSCVCKGELIPWVLWDSKAGKETDLNSMDEDEVKDSFSDEKVAAIISKGVAYEVGIYPAKDDSETFNLAEKDVFESCQGQFELLVNSEKHYVRNFNFDTVVNL